MQLSQNLSYSYNYLNDLVQASLNLPCGEENSIFPVYIKKESILVNNVIFQLWEHYEKH